MSFVVVYIIDIVLIGIVIEGRNRKVIIGVFHVSKRIRTATVAAQILFKVCGDSRNGICKKCGRVRRKRLYRKIPCMSCISYNTQISLTILIGILLRAQEEHMFVKMRQSRSMRRILKVSRIDVDGTSLHIRQGVRYQQTREVVGKRNGSVLTRVEIGLDEFVIFRNYLGFAFAFAFGRSNNFGIYQLGFFNWSCRGE